MTVRIYVVIGLLAMLQPLATSFYLPALPSLAADLHASVPQAQLTVSAALIGLAAGQFLLGSLSDRWGRRRLMIAGMALFVVASLLCALAPSMWVLILLRTVQGFAGAAGPAIGRASIRDMTSGTQTAAALSRLLAVIGVAPVVGPVLGGLILLFTTWRGLFVALAILGAISLAAAVLFFPETLPEERRLGRHPEAIGVRAALRELLTDRRVLVVLAITTSLGIISFGWSTTSPFYFIDWYHLTPQQYAFIVGANSLAFVVGATINSRAVQGMGPRAALVRGLILITTGAVLIVATTIVMAPVMWPIIIIVLTMGAYGGMIANAQVLGLGPHGHVAGTMSALLGTAQFVGGAFVPPIVTGLLGPVVALPLLLVASSVTALALTLRGTRRDAGEGFRRGGRSARA
jgi:DHA1 family bicyclomycin/chloramphenicol resistance-like MFS transporter